MAKIEEELKSFLKVKEKSEKSGLKLNLQNTKILASSPIISWQIEAEKMESMTDFIFLDSKITANSDYSQELKRCFLLGGKSYNKPRQCIKKQRHYFADQGLSSQSYGFSSSHV